VTATVHPLRPTPGGDGGSHQFPLRVHDGDDTGRVIARFDGLSLRLLRDMTARMDLTVVDTRTGRVVAQGGPILGQLQIAPDAVSGP
jgi:hypothetical protein